MREARSVRVRSAVVHVMQSGRVYVQHRTRSGYISKRLILALCVLVSLALAACRATTTQSTLPGGTYRNDTFHFSVSYQTGWQVNVAPASTASQGIPLHVVITRTTSLQSNSSLVSNCSITVLNTQNSDVALLLKPLKDRIQRKDTRLRAVSLGGQPGFQEEPVRQDIPGTQLSDTHTNYYLLLGTYVYEINTDAISSDNADAALQSMVASFTIVK